MADFDLLVIGAGVVGIACAREAALRGLSVLVLERNAAMGMETSSRNSEVVHAGLYYPTDSLKARCCVAGRERLYSYARRWDIAHKKCGKLIVSPERELATLDALAAKAKANGVDQIQRLDAATLRRCFPDLRAAGGLLSEHSGIVDSHALMLALVGEAEEHGAQFSYATDLLRLDWCDAAYQGWIAHENGPVFTVRNVVNAAGLTALTVAATIDGYENPFGYKQYYAKGTYYSYSGAVPFDRLIYPVPERGGLGIHLTLDLQGRARFGPNVEWVNAVDYATDGTDRTLFVEAIRSYWPKVDSNRLAPDYAGIRPKLVGPDGPDQDFVVEGPGDHGMAGLVNLFGIESPGLTASMALADMAIDALQQD